MKIRKKPRKDIAKSADDLAELYSTLKKEIAEKDQQLKAAGRDATELAKQSGVKVGKRVVVRTDKWEVGYLTKSRTTLDEDALKKKIGESKWAKVTLLTRVIDPQLLKKALSSGLISITTYKSCLVVTDGGTSPYIREAKEPNEGNETE